MTNPAAGPLWTVRRVCEEDVAALHRIASSAFDRDPSDGAALVDLFLGRPSGESNLGLVATARHQPAGFAFGSGYGDGGFVDMFAVDGPQRRCGVATALLTELESALAHRGARSISIGGNGHFYAWPGVDSGYTGALALAERREYRQRGEAYNMELDLNAWQPGDAHEVLLRHGGRVRARRATASDWPALSAFISEHFSDGWRDEAAAAVHRAVPTVFVAFREDTVVGFACHGVYRRDWFGPIGTRADERGSGIGEALLRLCLDDLAQARVPRVQISWVGPTGFYSRTVGARTGRRFVILSKDVPLIDPSRGRTAANPGECTLGG